MSSLDLYDELVAKYFCDWQLEYAIPDHLTGTGVHYVGQMCARGQA